jgi:hypothetical protein
MSIRSHATRFAVIVASIAVPISDASAQDPVAAAKQLTCDELFARVTAAYKALPAE